MVFGCLGGENGDYPGEAGLADVTIANVLSEGGSALNISILGLVSYLASGHDWGLLLRQTVQSLRRKDRAVLQLVY